ncbi:RodZ family helix-turn-helix domain-containing protein [Pseudovibrio exalbescens]|uniref:SPOR domain-containing protein n=1 Tax=Pseudovibrio exalbescens TaxID=197461 RepID=UPI00116101C9|nr:SPOR domain-containing protein [Pseudovibrio exalbescens]
MTPQPFKTPQPPIATTELPFLTESEPFQTTEVFKDNELAVYQPVSYNNNRSTTAGTSVRQISTQVAMLERQLGSLRNSNERLRETLARLEAHPPQPLKVQLAQANLTSGSQHLPAENNREGSTAKQETEQDAAALPSSQKVPRKIPFGADVQLASQEQAMGPDPVPLARAKPKQLQPPPIETLPAPEVAPEVYASLPPLVALSTDQPTVPLPSSEAPQLVSAISPVAANLTPTGPAGIVYGRAGSVFTRTAFAVDLGEFKSRGDAQTHLEHASAVSGLVAGVSGHVLAKDPDPENGIEYRAVAGPFANARDTALACAQLRAQNLPCRMVIHPK